MPLKRQYFDNTSDLSHQKDGGAFYQRCLEVQRDKSVQSPDLKPCCSGLSIDYRGVDHKLQQVTVNSNLDVNVTQ